jgi:hypothetical protein
MGVATMDVQADEASVRSDPSPTIAAGTPPAAVARPLRSVHQGNFFQDDPYPTFAQTDPTPVVPRAAPRRAPATSRGLRIAVVVAALAVAAAGTALALVETGVISTTSSTAGRTTAPTTRVTHPTAAPEKTLLTPAGFGTRSAAYTVDAPVFGLTITTSTGRSWVSVGIVGQKPVFEGILAANSSQRVTLLGPAELNIGAGGTTVTVTSNKRSQSLKPLAAPFTYTFTPGRTSSTSG